MKENSDIILIGFSLGIYAGLTGNSIGFFEEDKTLQYESKCEIDCSSVPFSNTYKVEYNLDNKKYICSCYDFQDKLLKQINLS